MTPEANKAPVATEVSSPAIVAGAVAAPSSKPSGFEAKGATLEDFLLNVTKTLIEKGLVIGKTSNPSKDKDGRIRPGTGNKPYLKFQFGTVPTRMGGLLWPLDETQGRRVESSAGVPLFMDFSVTLLEPTPRAAVAARIAERRVQTITRETNRAQATSTNVLLEELNRRRQAEGLEPIKA